MTDKEQLVNYYQNRISLNTDIYKSMYSPLFDKKFSELTDEEIKQQLDLWVEDNSFSRRFATPKKKTKEQQENDYRRFVRGNRR